VFNGCQVIADMQVVRGSNSSGPLLDCPILPGPTIGGV
jgi:hypothetical protein